MLIFFYSALTVSSNTQLIGGKTSQICLGLEDFI